MVVFAAVPVDHVFPLFRQCLDSRWLVVVFWVTLVVVAVT
jgi:hypothetical protein